MKPTFLLAFLFSVFSLLSCGERDSICDCIDASSQLNKEVNKVLLKEATKKDEENLLKLRLEKKKKCAEFENMSGKEMMERKESCGE